MSRQSMREMPATRAGTMPAPMTTSVQVTTLVQGTTPVPVMTLEIQAPRVVLK
jgi:hypothetical protein